MTLSIELASCPEPFHPETFPPPSSHPFPQTGLLFFSHCETGTLWYYYYTLKGAFAMEK